MNQAEYKVITAKLVNLHALGKIDDYTFWYKSARAYYQFERELIGRGLILPTTERLDALGLKIKALEEKTR